MRFLPRSIAASNLNTPSVILSNGTNGSRYLICNDDLNLWMATARTTKAPRMGGREIS